MTSNVPGLILLILIIAAPLTVLASVITLKLYRRAVLRGMRLRAHRNPIEPAPTGSLQRPLNPLPIPLGIEIVDPTTDRTEPINSRGLYSDLLRGPWRVAAIYAGAGLCYALVTTIIFLRATDVSFHPLSFMIIFWYYAWPVAVTISLVAAPTRRTRLMIFATYFLTIVVLGALAAIGNAAPHWLQIILLWLLTNLPAALLLLVFLNRRIQAVGPLVLTLMVFAATGLVLLPSLILNNPILLNFVIDMGAALGLGRDGIYLMLLLLSFLLFGGIGWLLLQRMGSWYRHKKISEQSITIDAIWLLFGIFQSVGLIFAGQFWFLASLLSFAVYKIAARAGFMFARGRPSSIRRPPRLLVLRVFSQGKRSERLFDLLAMYWRFVGGIWLIAGPDLATSTMEPHEFLDFLSGKLARQFIDSPQKLDERIFQFDRVPDHDGQFRVMDFFCYDDTWRMVLSRLAHESDAVLMDLRGFSSENAGCIFEINELVNLVPLGQVVFIIDHTTDEEFLHKILQQSWERMQPTSPNRQSTSGMLKIFRLGQWGDTEFKSFLKVLASAVQPETETQVLRTAHLSGLKSS